MYVLKDIGKVCFGWAPRVGAPEILGVLSSEPTAASTSTTTARKSLIITLQQHLFVFPCTNGDGETLAFSSV
jgi:hypothetical protein